METHSEAILNSKIDLEMELPLKELRGVPPRPSKAGPNLLLMSLQDYPIY